MIVPTLVDGNTYNPVGVAGGCGAAVVVIVVLPEPVLPAAVLKLNETVYVVFGDKPVIVQPLDVELPLEGAKLGEVLPLQLIYTSVYVDAVFNSTTNA